VSPHAGLRERVRGKKYWHDTIYAHSKNNTFRDQLWDGIDIDRSVIALDHDEAALLGLPRSQNFVWDETKGIYIINAYHQLHCIKTLYQVITEADRGQKMSFEYLHLTHCLDALRQEVECVADDSLLYSVEGDVIPVGEGQTLQCRDFAKLDEWALEHYACYTFHNLKPPYFSDGPEKYMNCHKDSEFFPKMREFLGHGEEWQPDYFVNFGPEFPDIASEEDDNLLDDKSDHYSS